MSETKFYYYEVWFEDEEKHKVPIEDLISKYELFPTTRKEIDRGGNKDYYLEFQNESDNYYGGRIRRVRSDDQYIHQEGEDVKVLADSIKEIGGEPGSTGQIERDIVNFGARVQDDRIIFLLQIGFQLPRIAAVRDYFEKEVDDSLKVRSRTIPDNDDFSWDDILDKELKSIEISLKKEPSEVNGSSLFDDLNQMMPDNYRIGLDLSIRKPKTGTKEKLKNLLKSVTPGASEDDLASTLENVDLPSLMSKFKIDYYVGEDGEKEVKEHNFLQNLKQEEVELEPEELANFKEMTTRLCRWLRAYED